MNAKLKDKIPLFEFGIFSFLTMLRLFSQGIKYFPVLDDYTQYGCYALLDGFWQRLNVNLWAMAKRPLAFLADICLWGGVMG